MRPNDPDARTDLGMTYFQYAQIDTARGVVLFQQAASEMETAFANSPRHQTSAFNLGVVNLHMGNLEESNKWFMKAVEIDKNSDLGIRAQKILSQHTLQQ
jgi:Tfp pilus assembly protein PilF